MKRLHYNERYWFEHNGTYCTVGRPKEIISDQKQITIDIGFGEKEYPAEWLGLLAHYEVNVPKEYLERIDFVPMESKSRRVRCRKQMVFSKNIPAWWAGFWIIPGLTFYCINDAGVIVSTKTGKVLETRLNAYEYPVFGAYDPDKNAQRNVACHVAYARVFVHNPNPSVNVVINHKNGIKTDMSKKNLEWVTSEQNNDHASMEGLNTQQRSMLMIDHFTGVVTAVSSVSEAFRLMGYGSTRRWSKTVNGKEVPVLFSHRWELQTLTATPKPWHHGKGATSKANKGPYQAKRLCDGTVIEAETAKEMSNLLGIPRDTLFYYFNGREDLDRQGYLFRLKSEKPWPKAVKASYSAKRKNIVAENEEGVTWSYSSLSEASRELKIDRNTLRRHINTNSRTRGYLVKHYVSPPQP